MLTISGRLLFIFFLFPLCSMAQSQRTYKYVIFFRDKDTSVHRLSVPETYLSPRAIERKKARQVKTELSDLPVNPAYLDQFEGDSLFTVHNSSRWFNCAVVFSARKNAAALLAGYKGVERVIDVGYSSVRRSQAARVDLDRMVSDLEQKFERRNRNDPAPGVYGLGLMQAGMLNVPALHSMGLDGNGTLVAVIDAGFRNANDHPVFAYTLRNVKTTYDFVDMEQNVFNDDDHGTAVWSCMAANDSFSFVGTAPGAGYVLLRSEDARTEFPVEEFYWAMAAEYADSMGADIISSSLGYNEFGDPRYNYSQHQLNGKTAWITRAAAMAAAKGMFVVNSGGNEGDDAWKQITFPADAPDVLTVGAVNRDGVLSAFSSLGPTADKRVKPELVAMGEEVAVAAYPGDVRTGNGTSYSCPVLAGGIACLWPVLKVYSNSQVRELLQLSASSYHRPDLSTGYGIPDLELAYRLACRYADDTLLDVRLLADKCIHLALYAQGKREVIVRVRGEGDTLYHEEKRTVKKRGNTRFALRKIKSLPAGDYTVEVIMNRKRFFSKLRLT